MTEVNTSNPLIVPYRTGSYLISDEGPADNFRSAMSLADHPYRASGSHQLGIADFVRVLGQGVVDPFRPSALFLIDLREETHGFFDGAPVSWYADNDFANVGQTETWIVFDEEQRVAACERRKTKLFVIKDDATDDLGQERVRPVSYTEIRPTSTRTEQDVAGVLTEVFRPTEVKYVRIPVTDHCAPLPWALTVLSNLEACMGGNDWTHFHCHGGDGRTSTFLALYDMLCWKRSGDPLPSLEEFAARQCELFAYCLDPGGCDCGKETTGWKLSLAQRRWETLGVFLSDLVKRPF